MKILFLAPQPFYVERGTPIAVRQVVESLCRNGHEVDLVTFHGGEDVVIPGMRHFRISPPPGIGKVPVGFSPAKLVCDLWLAATMLSLLRKTRYDVVHGVEESVFLALPFRRWGRFKLVYDMDSLMSDQLVEKWPALKTVHPALFWFERQAAQRADLVLAVCAAIADRVRPYTRERRLHVTPDAAMISGSDGDVEDLRNVFPTGGPLALYVGNLEGYQGVELLLRALAQPTAPSDCCLLVIGGDKGAIEKHETIAEQLGVSARVRFLGPRALAGLMGYLRQADVVCSPRIKGVNTPMKVYSYMASGAPILATNIASHTQVLDANCAMLVATTPEDMALGLTKLCGDAALRRDLAAAACQRVSEHYSLAAFEARLLAAYAQLNDVDAAAPSRSATTEGRIPDAALNN